MTAIAVPYSALVQAQADEQQLLLVVEVDPVLGQTVGAYPVEAPHVVFGSAWQPTPDGPWRATRSFLDPEPVEFDSVDAAILYSLTGGPLTKRAGYLWGRKNMRR